MNINRRQALAGLMITAAAPSSSSAIARPASARVLTPATRRPAVRPDYVEAADWLASLEHYANRRAWPDRWRLLRYACCIRWNDETLAFVGVGPPAVNAAARWRLTTWLRDRQAPIVGAAVSKDGRTWCLIVEAIGSDELRATMPRLYKQERPELDDQRPPARWHRRRGLSQ